MGYTDDDLDKPLIGVANAWSTTVPGHYNLRQVSAAVREGIRVAGGTPVEFGVIGACDGIAEGQANAAIMADAVRPGDVVVIRYEGPKGGPGMPEMFKAMKLLHGLGLSDKVALVTDGRFSGTNNFVWKTDTVMMPGS
jgi:dihydroxyacid dehydratase/phosphogluconate dehydratase